METLQEMYHVTEINTQIGTVQLESEGDVSTGKRPIQITGKRSGTDALPETV